MKISLKKYSKSLKQAGALAVKAIAIVSVILGASIIWQVGPSVLLDMVLPQVSTLQYKNNLPPFETKDLGTNSKDKMVPVIRLHDTDGQFFCSGFVISDIYAATAAHCVSSEETGIMRKKPVRIFSSELQETASAMAVGVNLRLDQAVLKGDFRKYNKVRIMLHPSEMLNIQAQGNIVCGFPVGSELTCYPIVIQGTNYFGLAGRGFLFPGDSGGPTIDLTTGVVFALNTAVTENGIYLSPLVGLLDQFGIKIR
jgi:hypothetical protein